MTPLPAVERAALTAANRIDNEYTKRGILGDRDMMREIILATFAELSTTIAPVAWMLKHPAHSKPHLYFPSDLEPPGPHGKATRAQMEATGWVYTPLYAHPSLGAEQAAREAAEEISRMLQFSLHGMDIQLIGPKREQLLAGMAAIIQKHAVSHDWVPCSDWNHNIRGLPPTDRLVLVNVHTGVGDDVRTAMIGHAEGKEWRWDIQGYGYQRLNADHITHWRQLPAAPKK